MARNLKLWNHWIAQVREIAQENKCFFEDTEDEDGNPKLMTDSDLKYYFDKESMFDYFKQGINPQGAFEHEVSHWSY